MTCTELITSIINNHDYNMGTDDARKLVALAYYMGREAATREVSDRYNAVLAEQRERAAKCRYHNLAMTIQGDVSYLYSGDYSGEMSATFGADETAQTVETLTK